MLFDHNVDRRFIHVPMKVTAVFDFDKELKSYSAAEDG